MNYKHLSNDEHKLYKISSNFRNAIEVLKASNPTGISTMLRFNFPDGCCEYISEILQRYLLEEHNIITNTVRYKRIDKNGQDIYHIWLKSDSFSVIDITGDQYDDYSNSVYVGDMDPFHTSFTFVETYTANRFTYQMQQDYYLIKSQMEFLM